MEQTIKIIIDALEDVKGQDIVTVDTTNKSSIFNTLIICSGNSSRQLSALANSVIESLKANNIKILNVEGKREGEWVLVDVDDIIVHIMLPQVRQYYSLEELWQK